MLRLKFGIISDSRRQKRALQSDWVVPLSWQYWTGSAKINDDTLEQKVSREVFAVNKTCCNVNDLRMEIGNVMDGMDMASRWGETLGKHSIDMGELEICKLCQAVFVFSLKYEIILFYALNKL